MSGERKKVGEWDFDGACAPKPGTHSMHATFTLGIFQWVPKAGGRGLAGELKRGKVVRRVRGLTSDPEPAFAEARRIVAELNGK